MCHVRTAALALTALLCLQVGHGISQEQPETLKDVMRQKLTHSQAVLEGFTMNDFDKVKRSAQTLGQLTRHEKWFAIRTPEYEVYTNELRRETTQLISAAEKKNADRAALAYVEMTLTCVRCHRHIRDERIGLAVPRERPPLLGQTVRTAAE